MRVLAILQQLAMIMIFMCRLQSAEAQSVFNNPAIFSMDQGLSSNAVRSIDKCKDGFIWIGTGDGLNRFDGNRFKVYLNDPKDTNSIADNRIHCVLASGDSIWVATDLGLSILNTRNNQISNLQFSPGGETHSTLRQPGFGVNLIYADPQGILWIGTRNQGLLRYDQARRKFQAFYWNRPDSIADNPVYNYILSICVSKTNDSILYAGTVSGLLEVNRYTQKIKRHFYPQADKKYETALNAFRRIYFHDNGLVYMGNWSTSLHTFNPETGLLTDVQLSGGKKEEIIERGISKILRKSSSELWITSGTGLIVLNTDSNKVVLRKQNDFNNSRFYGIDFIDESDRIWQATTNGVYLFDPVVQQFSTWAQGNPLNNQWGFNFYVLEDKSKNELVVLPRVGGTIYHFNLENKTWKSGKLAIPSGRKIDRFLVRGFARAPDGRYTISTDDGLFSYDDQSGSLNLLSIVPNGDNKRFGELLWDDYGRLWFTAFGDGLYRWNPAGGELKYYLKELDLPAGKNPLTSTGTLFEDSRKNIWICRNGGFVLYKSTEDRFHHFLSENDSSHTFPLVTGFAEDARGRVWVSGNDGWIGYADLENPEKGIIKKLDFYGMYGLTDIPRIRADNEGNIWGYTKKCLFRIDPHTDIPENYAFSYGVRETEFFSFNIISGNRVVFGGRNDIVLADTRLLRKNTEQPEPYITQIQVLEKPNTIGMVTVDTSQLQLKYWQNFFSFSFSAKAFTLGNEVKFRYRLKGLEDQWIEATGRNFVNYTNIPAGDYNFEVQAANNEGQWNQYTSSLPVFVATAWWNTWAFRVIAFCAIAFTAWQLYLGRLRQVRDKTRLKVEFEKKLANVEMSALLAQMNPHFLFNSLNSIDSYIIRNESKKASEYLNSFARLMRLILNNSRSNYISLKDELETLDLYLQMESLRFRDRFVYEIIVDDVIDTNMVNIPPMLVQPYVENAIWHGLMHKEANKGKSKVTIHIQKSASGIICVIEDNGIGRERAAAISSRAGTRSRKSMGMRITEDRIEIINKLYNTDTRVFIEDLTDEAGEPEGTRVELTIPA